MLLQKINTMFFRWYFNFIVIVFFFSCNTNNSTQSTLQYNDDNTANNYHYPIQYARHFCIQQQGLKKIICITENFKDTLFFEVDKKYNRLAIMGTIPVFQLYLLNALQNLVAIDDSKYYNLDTIQKLHQSQQIVELMPNLQWNYELLLSKKFDILITYSLINENNKLKQLLTTQHIQHLPYLDYLEHHPLGRAEWIKVLGCLINKDSLAGKIFSDIEKKYKELKSLTDTIKIHPSVFTEIMYGDVWYIAGRQSYIAQIIKDAGGKYVFDFHNYENSKPYSFEYVLKHAQNADYWIHLHQYKSLNELQNANSKYKLFKAFQNKKCFNNNKIQNQYGYNDYYESGICQPHLILKDLIKILHPAYFSNDSLQYYYLLPEE